MVGRMSERLRIRLAKRRARRVERAQRDPRHIAVSEYAREVAGLPTEVLRSFAPPNLGWNDVVESLATTRKGIALVVGVCRSFENSPDDLVFHVSIVPRRAIYRPFGDGFAVRADGSIRPLTEEE